MSDKPCEALAARDDEPRRIYVDGLGFEAINVAYLREAPEVQALIREAEARGMERAADTIDQMADAIDELIDEIEIFRGMKKSPSRKLMAMAEAVRDRLFRRAGHIPGNARAETARIRAEAAAIRGDTE